MSDRDEQDYPEPVRIGSTHYTGCWKAPGHHNCAVAMIRDLRERLKEVEEERDEWRRRVEAASTDTLRVMQGEKAAHRRSEKLEEAVREADERLFNAESGDANDEAQTIAELRRALADARGTLRRTLDSGEDEGDRRCALCNHPISDHPIRAGDSDRIEICTHPVRADQPADRDGEFVTGLSRADEPEGDGLFTCPECGERTTRDRDGLCVMCGADLTDEPEGDEGAVEIWCSNCGHPVQDHPYIDPDGTVYCDAPTDEPVSREKHNE